MSENCTRIFLSGSRDVSDFLAQAYEVVERVGFQEKTSRPMVKPYYWEFEEDQDRQLVSLSSLPRSTDPEVRAVVFIFGNRLGHPVPLGSKLPAGFQAPSFMSNTAETKTPVKLTYTAFEFIDWHNENLRRQANGEEPIPGFVFVVGPNVTLPTGNTQVDSSANEQSTWMEMFLEHYFEVEGSTLPGLRMLTTVIDPTDFPDRLRKALGEELKVSEQVPWRKALRGLQRYEETDRKVFFGRDTDVLKLSRVLLRRHGEESEKNVVLVDGPSGVGKSSFIRAGFVGAIRDGLFNAIGLFTCVCVTPDDLNTHKDAKNASAVIARILLSAFPKVSECDIDFDREDENNWDIKKLNSLIPALLNHTKRSRPEFRLSNGSSSLVFVLDQAELAFDPIENKEIAFEYWEELLYILTELAKTHYFRLIIVLPSDRSTCLNIRHRLGRFGRFPLQPFSPEKIEETIQEIVAVCDAKLKPDKLKTFIAQAKVLSVSSRTAPLPLLSLSLYELFKQADAGVEEPQPSARELPDDNLETAIDTLFTRAISVVHESDRKRYVNTLLPFLVSFDRVTGNIKLLACSREEITDSETLPIWDQFKSLQLIVNLGAGRYRLVHESVLIYWQMARDWCAEERVLWQSYCTFMIETNQHKTGAAELGRPTKQRIYDAAFLLARRKKLLSETGGESHISAYLKAFLDAHYKSEYDLDISSDLISSAGLCIEIGLDDIIRRSLNNVEGSVAHLETGLVGCLYLAILHSKFDLAICLLQAGCDPNKSGFNGWSPLHLAATKKNPTIVSSLLAHGADPIAVGPSGETALVAGLTNNSLAFTKFLLENFDVHAPANINAFSFSCTLKNAHISRLFLDAGVSPYLVSSAGRSALFSSAESGHTENLRYLLSLGLDTLHADPQGWTPLHAAIDSFDCFFLLAEQTDKDELLKLDHPRKLLVYAAARDNVEVFHFLLKRGANHLSDQNLADIRQSVLKHRNFNLFEAAAVIPKIFDTKFDQVELPLFGAIAADDLELMTWLLESGASPNVRDLSQNTPLHRSVDQHNTEAVKLLLKHGGDTHALDENGNTPLHISAMRGNQRSTRLLAAAMTDINVMNSKLETPLHMATGAMQNGTVQLLIQMGASIDGCYGQDWSPLHSAVHNGSIIAVGLILTRIANPDLHDLRGQTPLMLAARFGHHRIVKLLIDYSAQVDATDHAGMSALGHAAANGHVESVEIILKSGKDQNIDVVDSTDAHGWGALHHAVWSGHATIVKAVLAFGATVNLETIGPHMLATQIAAESGDAACMQVLIDYSANFTVVTADKPSPITLAIKYQNFDTAILLLQHARTLADEQGKSLLSKLSEQLWLAWKKKNWSVSDVQLLLYNMLIEGDIISREKLSIIHNPGEELSNWPLYNRFINASGTAWASPEIIPSEWSSPNIQVAVKIILALFEAQPLEKDLLDKIDGLRVTMLNFCTPLTKLYEARLKTSDYTERSILFLKNKNGFSVVTGKVALNNIEGIRIISPTPDYVRYHMSTFGRGPDYAPCLILEKSTLHSVSSSILSNDVSDLTSDISQLVIREDETGRLAGTTYCTVLDADKVLDISLEILENKDIVFATQTQRRQIRCVVGQEFQNGVRTIFMLESEH